MSESKLFIPTILGTPRKDRESENVAKWVYSKMQDRDEIESKFFDVRDFDLPRDNYGTEIGCDFPEWRDSMARADGLVIVTPEYNHGYRSVKERPGSVVERVHSQSRGDRRSLCRSVGRNPRDRINGSDGP